VFWQRILATNVLYFWIIGVRTRFSFIIKSLEASQALKVFMVGKQGHDWFCSLFFMTLSNVWLKGFMLEGTSQASGES